GGVNGIKVSVILYFVLVGIGGWFLGWALGWGALARIFMGALIILKGNMQGSIGLGYFQLGVTQAYFPWIFAGALAMPRYARSRWAVELLATSLALLFLAGNIYYILSLVILVLITAAFYTVRLSLKPLSLRVNSSIARRYLAALLLAGGLMAASAITIAVNFSLMGNHDDYTNWVTFNVFRGLWQFIYPELLSRGLWTENAYTYVAPFWFVIPFVILLPPIRALHRPAMPKFDRPFWWIGIIAFILFASWGMGVNPIIKWMYANLPLLAQWRTPERMLTVASFLVIFLLSYRLDGLYRAILVVPAYPRTKLGQIAKALIGGGLVLIVAIVVADVYLSRNIHGYLEREDASADTCVLWLRAQHPTEFISVHKRDYSTTAPLIRNHIRMAHIGADYDLNGVRSNIYPYDLTNLLPEYYMPVWDDDLEWLEQQGYRPVADSPRAASDISTACVWHKRNAISDAFTVPLERLVAADYPLHSSITSPITDWGRTPEHIWLVVAPSEEDQVVVAQEAAYPGWIVRVNGSEATLESVGQLLGVIIPAGDTPHLVEFIYTAPTLKLGGMITLFTAFGLILYLLRVDKVIDRFRQRVRA